MLAGCRIVWRTTGDCCGRDAMDRDFSQPLDLAALASIAVHLKVAPSRRSRRRSARPPHCYLQRRRIERAMFLLRTTDLTVVTDIVHAVRVLEPGVVQPDLLRHRRQSPSEFRSRGVVPVPVPTCFVRAWTRPSDTVPSRFGEATADGRSVR